MLRNISIIRMEIGQELMIFVTEIALWQSLIQQTNYRVWFQFVQFYLGHIYTWRVTDNASVYRT